MYFSPIQVDTVLEEQIQGYQLGVSSGGFRVGSFDLYEPPSPPQKKNTGTITVRVDYAHAMPELMCYLDLQHTLRYNAAIQDPLLLQAAFNIQHWHTSPLWLQSNFYTIQQVGVVN